MPRSKLAVTVRGMPTSSLSRSGTCASRRADETPWPMPCAANAVMMASRLGEPFPGAPSPNKMSSCTSIAVAYSANVCGKSVRAK
jgi:hypothetical protein